MAVGKSEAKISVTPVATGAKVSGQMRDLMASKMHEALAGFTFCNAIQTLVESKLVDDLRADGTITVGVSAARHKYDQRQLLGLLRYFVTQELFKEEEGERFRVTPLGEAALSTGAVGFLHLYRGGYGELMFQAGKLLDGSLVYGKDIRRQGRFVAQGSGEITRATINEVPHSVIERAGARTVVDLGCVGGDFLIDFVKRSPQHRGIGVDEDPRAIELATEQVKAAGVADQVKLVLGNAFDLSAIATECMPGDFFYSFAMEHEVLRDGEAALLSHIDKMSELFPGKRYLVGEPMLQMNQYDAPFFWVHVL